MTRLTLVGPSEDGLHLVVESESGDRFELPLSDELRHAVRYTRPSHVRPAADEDADAPSMSPREIQQRIRAGLTAAELAELTGMTVATIEKYEGPVAAERGYIAGLARETRIGRDASAPQLGELVTDRLAARGVDPETVVWDAWREADEPWKVAADYRVSGRSVRALWTFDHTARTVTAEDEEARWLSETELLDVPIPRRHLSAVREAEADAALPLQATRPLPPRPSPRPWCASRETRPRSTSSSRLRSRPRPSFSSRTSTCAAAPARPSPSPTRMTTSSRASDRHVGSARRRPASPTLPAARARLGWLRPSLRSLWPTPSRPSAGLPPSADGPRCLVGTRSSSARRTTRAEPAPYAATSSGTSSSSRVSEPCTPINARA
ncbi:septation protein SepH [Demequina sediminis]|uniref:septation protein SepH n=1 Tax=Demequina sediminis TaxID=1930058 RepID=UPI003305EDEC